MFIVLVPELGQSRPKSKRCQLKPRPERLKAQKKKKEANSESKFEGNVETVFKSEPNEVDSLSERIKLSYRQAICEYRRADFKEVFYMSQSGLFICLFNC